MSDRFYCPDPPREGRFLLGSEESRHLTRVCRVGIGDRVEIFDGLGFATDAEVVALRGEAVELIPVGDPLPEYQPPCSLVLATAVPKGDRFDWLVEKATELGVDRLIPIIAERSVVDPRRSKLARLRRSIVEASKQCRRARLMILDEPVEWPRLAGADSEAVRFVADPRGDPPVAWPALRPGRDVILAVGPEGGFTPDEIELAIRAGWSAIQLGRNTLRIETAGLAGCAALLSRVLEIVD